MEEKRKMKSNSVDVIYIDDPIEFLSATGIVKGMSRHPLSNTWKNMIRRCYNPKDKDYKHYGARGIRVYLPWHNFLQFIMDIPKKPKNKKVSLDRINVNGDYCPKNIRWADQKTQMKNRRKKS
jgi:hypothetical protein